MERRQIKSALQGGEEIIINGDDGLESVLHLAGCKMDARLSRPKDKVLRLELPEFSNPESRTQSRAIHQSS